MVKQISVKHIACLSLLSTSMAHAAERPNIIYIFTDQHTANAMSCAGNPDLHTPNLDRLAAAGIMFQNAYCAAPLSGPSRGAMFTGCYPGTAGLLVNGAPLQESLQTRTLGTLVKMQDTNAPTAANGMCPNSIFRIKCEDSTKFTNTVMTDWQRHVWNSFRANTTSLSSW